MTKTFSACVLATAIGLAQTAASQRPAASASVTGVVRDKGTGKPLANYAVSTSINATWVNDTIVMSGETRQVSAITDEQGRYKLTDLPPGVYRIQAYDPTRMGAWTARRVTLAANDLNGIDFSVLVMGTISGRVVDENKEPVPGMSVFLISRQYYLGATGYFLKDMASTDDRGRYTLRSVPAGHPYLVMAEKRDRQIPVHSEAPLNPKLRKRAPMRTYYPNSPAKEGGAMLLLSSGDHREGVDIEIRKAPSYCIDGTLETPNGPKGLSFQVEAQQPSSGTSGDSGMFVVAPGAVAGPDGKFRVCDLTPGTYRLTAREMPGPSNYAATQFTIVDEDLRNLKIVALPGMPLEGAVVWDGTPPEKPVTAKVSVWLEALLRAHYLGEHTDARSEIPGTFSFPGLLLDDYRPRPFLNVPGLYIKDVTYGGRSIRHEPLRLGSAMAGATLRIVVAHDGAKLIARVADKDGNPMPDIQVLVMPAEVTTEGMLSATMISGQTDQLGQYTSSTLAPGKYYVVATGESFEATPESVGRLWRSRNRFKEVELPPNGSTQLKLVPVTIE